MAPTEGATVKLAEYPDRFLDCRAFGHAWSRGKPEKGAKVNRSRGSTVFGTGVNLVCRTCGMGRFEVYTSGKVARLVYRRYDQPEGYRNQQSFTPSEYKAELFRRENNGRRRTVA